MSLNFMCNKTTVLCDLVSVQQKKQKHASQASVLQTASTVQPGG